MGDAVIDEQNFEYDWLTNITSTNSCDCNQCFQYDGNNRLTSYNGYPISYDMDGNMLNTVVNERNIALAFDSANRLIKADGTEYIYTAEDVRIKAVTGDKVTTYTYNTNCRLSQLLTKTTNGVVTKYVYGLGLIGEETDNSFKTYHFDYRGSTTAITDENGNITDTFKYDTYGNVIEHTGTSDTPFLFNGQDGVMTEQSGLIYMRARYYNPEIKRFINADILAGTIDNLPSLNRYAYAEGNPVSNVDPLGLSVERSATTSTSIWDGFKNKDGSYSLYDSRRHNPDSVFHEQILVFTPSTPSLSWKTEDFSIGLGSISVDAMTGGWEGEHVNLYLLDLGHAEAGLEIKNGKLNVGLMASIWSPSFSIDIFGINIEIGAEVGAIGMAAKGEISASKKEIEFRIGGGIGFFFKASC